MSFLYIWLTDPDIWGIGTSLSATIWFAKVYSGVYVEPGAQIHYGKTKGGSGIFGNVSGVFGGPYLLFGYGWFWDSGFNVNLGIGPIYYFGKELSSSAVYDGPSFVGKLMLGYAF